MKNGTHRVSKARSYLLSAFCLLLTVSFAAAQTARPQAAVSVQDFQNVIARQAALVSEFDVNGLKVLVKRREGSLTVAAGLFIRGGTRNISAANAGIESLMLASATEATTNFPRQRMRSELSRMGTVLGSSVTYD